MSIWYMNGKTFQKKMMKNEDPDAILRAKYGLISSRITSAKRYPKKILIMKALFPNSTILADLGIADEKWSIREYKKQLKQNREILAIIIHNAIVKNRTFILLCSEIEWKVLGKPSFMEHLADFCMEEFGYPLYDYKKYKNGKIGKIDYDKKQVLKKCKKVIEEARVQRMQKDLKSPRGRKRVLNEMTVDEMRKLLDNYDIYTSGMSRKEMRSLIKKYIFDI